MQIRGYPIRVYQEDDGSWAAEVPDLPGCVAGGADPTELFEMLGDAIEEWIQSAMADGVSVPRPSRRSKFSGRFVVRTPPSLHEQLSWRADQEEISLNSLVLVALTTYLAGAQPEPAIQAFRSPIGFDWDIKSADVVMASVRYRYFGDEPVRVFGEARATAGNQMEMIKSLDPVLQ